MTDRKAMGSSIIHVEAVTKEAVHRPSERV
jgi:hypothetical protein